MEGGRAASAARTYKKTEQFDCITIINIMLPAVRASVAEKLNQLGYSQNTIAEKLGIAQAAVSKYRNRKYSIEVGRVKEYIDRNGLYGNVVKEITEGCSREKIEKDINALCEELIINYN